MSGRKWARCWLVVALLGAGCSAWGAQAASADSIVVRKAARLLEVYRQGKVVQKSRVGLGGAPVGTKYCEGDGRTPEGKYQVVFRNAASHYHRSLLISYPSAHDRREAKTRGCDPGGAIMIHGVPNGMGRDAARFLARDWTLGCVALTDAGIDSLWAVAKTSTVVVIHP